MCNTWRCARSPGAAPLTEEGRAGLCAHPGAACAAGGAAPPRGSQSRWCAPSGTRSAPVRTLRCRLCGLSGVGASTPRKRGAGLVTKCVSQGSRRGGRRVTGSRLSSATHEFKASLGYMRSPHPPHKGTYTHAHTHSHTYTHVHTHYRKGGRGTAAQKA